MEHRRVASNLPSPYPHDRTIVTVVVLVAGSVLVYHYGESVPIMVLVSSAWTLALTFWFRVKSDEVDRTK
jgi:uncharacterized membrane protein YccC